MSQENTKLQRSNKHKMMIIDFEVILISIKIIQ